MNTQTDDNNRTAVAGPVEQQVRPGAEARPLVERLRSGVYGTNRIPLCDEAADEIERLRAALAGWRAAAVPALAWMEGAWSRIDGEWGPSGKTLDQECTDGDEPEIAALRSRVGRLVDEQKKTMEHKTISVQRFRDYSGAPTCCADHSAGETCRFLGVRNFGTVDVCMLGAQRDLAPRTTGFQRPDALCEVWADA